MHLSRLAKGDLSQEGTSVSATGFSEEQTAEVVTGPPKTELAGDNGEANAHLLPWLCSRFYQHL